jgi:Domain of unknown function (DUF5655)
MPVWTCSDCKRQFARNRQSHECAPAITLDEYLASGPVFEAPIVRAVLDVVASFDDVIIEPVSVGVFMKAPRTFAQLRPMTRWESLWLFLPRTIEHSRFTRRMPGGPNLTVHAVRLTTPADLDAPIVEWLTEAYESAR